MFVPIGQTPKAIIIVIYSLNISKQSVCTMHFAELF